jgi:hypothetical protein
MACSGRSTAGVATRKQAREIARSAAVGRSLIGADHDMMLILNAGALDEALPIIRLSNRYGLLRVPARGCAEWHCRRANAPKAMTEI